MLFNHTLTKRWVDRFVLLLIISTASLAWGISLTCVEQIELILSNQFIMVILLSSFVASVLLCAKAEQPGGLWNLAAPDESFFKRHQWWIVGLLACSYAIVMSYVSLLKHLSFNTHAFDLAIFDQAIWSTTKGKFLFSSLKDNICLLGDHMSPVLLLFTPLYWLWDDVGVLLIAQSLVAASCFIPLALIAEKKLGKGIFVVCFALALFFYQPLRHSVRAEFHPELLANPIALWAFYFLMGNKTKSFMVALVLLVMCKENMYGVSFVFGCYLLLQKRFKIGVLIMALSVASFYIVTQEIIPQLSGKPYFYQGNYAYLFAGNWGSDPPLIIQPLGALEYISKIFLPLGLLSFLHLPTLFLTLPILLQNLLSRNTFMHSIAFQYTAGLTPFVFISAIHGTAALLRYFEPRTGYRLIRSSVLIGTTLLSLSLAGRPERQYFYKYKVGFTEHKKMIQNVVHKLPEYLSVTANQNLVPHMSHRFQIKQFEDFQRMPQSSAYPIQFDLVVLDRDQTSGTISEEIKKVKLTGFHVIYERDGFYVLQRNHMTGTLNLAGVLQGSRGAPQEFDE